MQRVFILSYCRTPFGRAGRGGGVLSDVPFAELGAAAVRGCVERAGLSNHADAFSELFLGCVCGGGLGQNPPDQVRDAAGLPFIPATLVNKVCASSLKAVSFARLSAMVEGGVYVVAGAESMSAASHVRTADGAGTDLLTLDGLTDAVSGRSMGDLADAMAEADGISADAQNAFAVRSIEAATASLAPGGPASWEIVPVRDVTEDEQIAFFRTRDHAALQATAARRTACFRTNEATATRTVTSFTSSGINDGAAAVLVANETTVRALRAAGAPVTVVAEIIDTADAAVRSADYCVAPAAAITKLLDAHGVTAGAVERFVLNEAFAAVAIANSVRLGLSDADRDARVNVLGDALAIGHPLGASGVRSLGSLISALRAARAETAPPGVHRGLGVAALCNGGGGATAVLVRVVDDIE